MCWSQISPKAPRVVAARFRKGQTSAFFDIFGCLGNQGVKSTSIEAGVMTV